MAISLCLGTLCAGCVGVPLPQAVLQLLFASARCARVASVASATAPGDAMPFASARCARVASPAESGMATSTILCLGTLCAGCVQLLYVYDLIVGALCLGTLCAGCVGKDAQMKTQSLCIVP